MNNTDQDSLKSFFSTIDLQSLSSLSEKLQCLQELESVVAECKRICTFHRALIESRRHYFAMGDIRRMKRGIALFELVNAFALSGRTQYFEILNIDDDADFEQTIQMRWVELKIFRRDMGKLNSLGLAFKVIDRENAKRRNFVKMMKKTFPLKPWTPFSFPKEDVSLTDTIQPAYTPHRPIKDYIVLIKNAIEKAKPCDGVLRGNLGIGIDIPASWWMSGNPEIIENIAAALAVEMKKAINIWRKGGFYDFEFFVKPVTGKKIFKGTLYFNIEGF